MARKQKSNYGWCGYNKFRAYFSPRFAFYVGSSGIDFSFVESRVNETRAIYKFAFGIMKVNKLFMIYVKNENGFVWKWN
jgi:hypothetical protein